MTQIEWVTLFVSALVCWFYAERYAKMRRERDSLQLSVDLWRAAAEGWERRAEEWRQEAIWRTNRDAPASDVAESLGKMPPKKLC